MRRLLLACLLLLPAPARAQTEAEIYEQVVEAGEVLASGTEEERAAAADALAGLRAVYSVPMLEDALSDPSVSVRIAAVVALGSIAHPDAVEALEVALSDTSYQVAAAAAVALGDMHTDESYGALIAALPGLEDGMLKSVVLDGLRKWNEPFTPLPEPRTLPGGMDPPLTGKSPGAKTIDKTNPYGEAVPGPPPPEISKEIDSANPYGPSSPVQGGPSLSAALKAGSSIDKDNPYDEISFEGEQDTWGQAPEPPPPGPPPPVPATTLPPLTLSLHDMAPASFVSFEAATAAVDDGAGRVTVMQIRGGYSGNHMAGGAIIPFAGGSSVDPEEWIFGNLGLWARYAGARDFDRLTLRYAGALTMHVPSGDSVTWSDFGKDPDYFPSMGALYATYYAHGLMYPDLEDSFQVALRPDLEIGLTIGPLSFQLELGFDFVVLGKARDRGDRTWMRGLKDLVMFHLGLGTYVSPLPWLQLSVELESTVEVVGRSAETWLFDSSFAGERAGSEALITPGVSVILPMSGSNAAHLTLALRVPLGEIGSAAGPMQLGPILVLQTGFRWGRP